MKFQNFPGKENVFAKKVLTGTNSAFVVDLCYFSLLEDFSPIKLIKSVKVFPFSFLKILICFLLHKNQTFPHKHAKWPPSDLAPWTLTLIFRQLDWGFVSLFVFLFMHFRFFLFRETVKKLNNFEKLRSTSKNNFLA